LFKVGNEDSLWSPSQQPRQIRLAQVQGQLAQILAVEGQDIEGVELNFVIMPARVQSVQIGDTINAKQYRLATMTNELERFRRAASTISGKRSLQSWPLRVNSRTRLPSRWTIKR
jgi:hypothetical protein